jgi:hypothetical protein
MPIGEYNHPLFGLVKFETEHDYWKYSDLITFIDGFDKSDVEDVYVPQLKNVKDAHGGTIKFTGAARGNSLPRSTTSRDSGC